MREQILVDQKREAPMIDPHLEALKRDLKGADTVEDFLQIISKHYDLKNARPGILSKAALISNIGHVIKLSGAKPRNKN